MYEFLSHEMLGSGTRRICMESECFHYGVCFGVRGEIGHQVEQLILHELFPGDTLGIPR